MGFSLQETDKLSQQNNNTTLNRPGYNAYSGTVVSATATTITLDTDASGTDNFYNSKILEITSGIGNGTFRKILDYNGTTKTLTVEKMGDIPTSETTIIIHQNSGILPRQTQSGYYYSVKLNDEASSLDSFYNVAVIQLIKPNGARMSNYINTYNGTTKVCTFKDNWHDLPKEGDIYMIYGESGIATAGTSTTITLDGNQSDRISANMLIGIYHGSGSTEINVISDITGNVVTVEGDWDIVPDTSSKYVIYGGWYGLYEDIEKYSKITVSLKIKRDERVFVVTSLSHDMTDANAEHIQKNVIFESNQTHTIDASAKYYRIILTGMGTSITGSVLSTFGFAAPKDKSVNDQVNDDTDCTIVRSVITGKSIDNGKYKNISTDHEGNLNMNIMQPRDIFGNVVVAEPKVMVEMKFPYSTTHFLQDYFFNGSAGFLHDKSVLTAITGTTASSTARLKSTHRSYYSGGLALKVRFSALFSTPQSGCTQIIGHGDQNNGYFFGYSGTNFGILKRCGGKSEIRIVQILSAATSTGDVTVELDGNTTTVAVTSGDSIFTVARKLAKGTLVAPYYLENTYAYTGCGWISWQDNDKVYFMAEDSGAHSGTYSVSGQGVTGGFATYQTGIAATDEWTPQNEWNIDRTDETTSLPVLDFSKGNIFEIDMQWLGFGNIAFKIENPETGRFSNVHLIRYPNRNSTPSIEVPHQPLMIEATNGATTGLVSVSTSCMTSFTLGKANIYNATRFGSSVIKRQTLKKGKYYNILSLRNSPVLMGTENVVSMLGLSIASSWKANQSAIFHTLVNATLAPQFSPSIETAGTAYSVSEDQSTTGGTGSGLTVDITSVGGSGEITGLVIDNYGAGYTENDVLTIGGGTGGTIKLNHAGLTWTPRKANVSSADLCKDSVEVIDPGEEHFSISMGPNTRFFETFNDMEIYMPPNFTLTLAMQPIADETDAEYSCSFFWSEKF